MTDTIVYTRVSHIGNHVSGAYLNKQKAEDNSYDCYHKIVPIVIDLDKLAQKTLLNLDPIARLAVEHHLMGKQPYTGPARG